MYRKSLEKITDKGKSFHNWSFKRCFYREFFLILIFILLEKRMSPDNDKKARGPPGRTLLIVVCMYSPFDVISLPQI